MKRINKILIPIIIIFTVIGLLKGCWNKASDIASSWQTGMDDEQRMLVFEVRPGAPAIEQEYPDWEAQIWTSGPVQLQFVRKNEYGVPFIYRPGMILESPPGTTGIRFWSVSKAYGDTEILKFVQE